MFHEGCLERGLQSRRMRERAVSGRALFISIPKAGKNLVHSFFNELDLQLRPGSVGLRDAAVEYTHNQQLLRLTADSPEFGEKFISADLREWSISVAEVAMAARAFHPGTVKHLHNGTGVACSGVGVRRPPGSI
jgi:hypothetical protein